MKVYFFFLPIKRPFHFMEETWRMKNWIPVDRLRRSVFSPLQKSRHNDINCKNMNNKKKGGLTHAFQLSSGNETLSSWCRRSLKERKVSLVEIWKSRQVSRSERHETRGWTGRMQSEKRRALSPWRSSRYRRTTTKKKGPTSRHLSHLGDGDDNTSSETTMQPYPPLE